MTARWSPEGPNLPTRQIMSQWWRDIVFAHWPVDPARIAPLLPRGVRPDLYDGSAWVGLIPFRMVDAGVLTGPPVPWLGTFLEMNVRTYTVDDAGRHGVFFCSLEAERALVVAGARALFNVPYFWAKMRYDDSPGSSGRRTLEYRTDRKALWPNGSHRHPVSSRMRVTVGEPVTATGLDVFLTARFGLHTSLLGRPLWVPNTHESWPLTSAELVDLDDGLLAAAGFPDLADQPPASVLYSQGVRTTFGLPQRV